MAGFRSAPIKPAPAEGATKLPGPVPPFLVELAWDNVTATVTVHGVVDSRTAVALIGHVFEIVGTCRPECLVLDLHHVSSADMAGAAAVGAIQAALDGECMVIIRRPRPEMCRLIEIAQWCADWLETQRPTGTAGAADVDQLDGLGRGWNEELSELRRSDPPLLSEAVVGCPYANRA